MSDKITVNVNPVGEPGPEVTVEVERHSEGWITTNARPAGPPGFAEGDVELTLESGPEGVEFEEGVYRATAVEDYRRVLFVRSDSSRT